MCLDMERINNLPDNILIKCNPELYNEWDFEKNSELGYDIFKITKGMHKKIWWICSKGHSYDCMPCHRRSGKGCPYCSGQKVNNDNCLATTNPNLASEWHPILNGELTPYNVTKGRNKKAWWQCSLGHEWEANIASRNNGVGCPYCSGRIINKENSLPILFPEIFKDWDFEKNKKLDPYKIGKGYGKKVWWTCEKGHSYDASPNNRTSKSHGCPYCSKQRVCNESSLASLNPILSSEWNYDKNKNTPYDYTANSGQKVWWKCKLGHEWCAKIGERNIGINSCPYCSNKLLLVGFNDINTTHKEYSSWLMNYEDGYKSIMKGSNFLNFKCPNCGNEFSRRVSDVLRYGLSCQLCSDGFSYPHKFMKNLLKSLYIEFKEEVRFDWSNRKVYDFYIPSLDCIIETHGKQHYEEVNRGRSLKEEQENDEVKRELALNNDIANYIELDCRKSNLNWIKNSIYNSELVNMINLNSVNWIQIATESEKSLVVECWNLYNNKVSTEDIIRELGFSKGAYHTYIKKGRELGIVGYNHKPTKIIIELDENMNAIQEFDNFSQYYKENNKKGQILRVLRGERNHYKGLKYIYKEDYEKLVTEQN